MAVAKSRFGRRDLRRGFRSLLGLGAAAVLFLTFRGFSQATPPERGEEPSFPPLCDAWHRGTGEGAAIDLAQIRRGYDQVRNRLSESLRRSIQKEAGRVAAQGYDLRIRACTGPGTRRLKPGSDVPPEFRGKSLWFFPQEGEKDPRLPAALGTDPTVLAFLVRTPDLGSLEKASKSLGRPVCLAPRGLAEALGVRCVPALVWVSENGEVEIHEIP